MAYWHCKGSKKNREVEQIDEREAERLKSLGEMVVADPFVAASWLND